MTQVIAYYRVSTDRQGKSGLGLEAQKAAVLTYVSSIGGRILREFTEIESGKRVVNRPQLKTAIRHAKGAGALLVIAKLDRLARNVAFLSALMEEGLEFRACDNPHADRFTIHILAAVAEKEAKDISDRTKAALQAYKARGGKLGSARVECKANLSCSARQKGQRIASEQRTSKAREQLESILPLVTNLKSEGMSTRKIASSLAELGYRVSRELIRRALTLG